MRRYILDPDSLPWIIHWRRYCSILTIHFNKKKNKIVRVIKSMEWIALQEIMYCRGSFLGIHLSKARRKVLIKSVAQSTLTYILHEHFSLTNYIR
jgi:hypothetical protein